MNKSLFMGMDFSGTVRMLMVFFVLLWKEKRSNSVKIVIVKFKKVEELVAWEKLTKSIQQLK